MLIYVLRWRPSWISDRHNNRNLVMDIPIIIHLQFGFSQIISCREEDLWNFSQSEHIIVPGSHIEYPTGTKNSNFVEDHPRNIPAKFGSNRPSGFGGEAWKVKSLQTTDNRRRTPSDGNSELKKDRNKRHSSPFINVVKGVFFVVRATLVPVSYLSAPSAVHSYRVPGKFIRRLNSLFV
jgi:hypothetical protein